MAEEKQDKEWICIYFKKQNCNYHNKVLAGLQKELKEKQQVILLSLHSYLLGKEGYDKNVITQWIERLSEKLENNIDEVFGKVKK